MVPEITSRSGPANAAGLLAAGTLVIVIDVRIEQFDLIADAVGGVLIVIANLRVQASIRGAEGTTMLLVVVALIGLVPSIIETVAGNNPIAATLGIVQPFGALVIANLLARALATSEPALSEAWRLTRTLVLWLGIVPLVVFQAIGFASGGVQIETPLAIPLLVILVIPLIYLLVSLSRTARVPAPWAGPIRAPDGTRPMDGVARSVRMPAQRPRDLLRGEDQTAGRVQDEIDRYSRPRELDCAQQALGVLERGVAFGIPGAIPGADASASR